jgi:hypothetical protein
MSIVVYWIEEQGQPACRRFAHADLTGALKHSEAMRAAGRSHVCISAELPGAVGAAGVTAVEGGRLPSGEDYTFNKRHRGAGPTSGG